MSLAPDVTNESTSDSERDWASQHFLAIALALVWTSTALLQRYQTPALGAQLASLALAAPLALWALSRQHLKKKPVAFVLLATLPIGHMLAASLASENPTVALLGTPPHWNGWLLWAGLLAWFLIVLVGVERHDLTDVSRVLAFAGGACAVWVFAEATGIVATYDPIIGNSMALFDNPLSLGQALLVTLAGTLALAMRWRISSTARLGYAVLATVQIAVLFATGARGALLGLAMGIAAFAVTETGRTPLRRVFFFAGCTAAILFLLLVAGTAAAWSGFLGDSAYERANAVLTGRLSIWTDVAELSAEDPVLGVGPSRFETVVDWRALPDGRISEWFTYSEHSLLLTWLLGAGIIGLVVFGLAALAVSLSLLRLARAPSASASARVLVAGCVATFVAMLTAWPDPLTLLSVSVIAGGLIGSAQLQRTPSGWEHSAPTRLAVVSATAVLLATALAVYALAPEVSAQFEVASARATHPTDHRFLASEFREGFASTRDPFYLQELLLLGVLEGGATVTGPEAIALTHELAKDYPKAAEGRTDIPALALELLWIHRARIEPSELWRLSRFFVDKGLQADPDMAIWSYTLARAAYGAQRPEMSEIIERAFDTTQPVSAQTLMVQWAASTIR